MKLATSFNVRDAISQLILQSIFASRRKFVRDCRVTQLLRTISTTIPAWRGHIYITEPLLFIQEETGTVFCVVKLHTYGCYNMQLSLLDLSLVEALICVILLKIKIRTTYKPMRPWFLGRK